MRTAIPPLTDPTDDRKHLLQREHDGHKKPRLQMLYLLATGQAHTRQDVAHLLGVHRHTIGRWLALYAAGGLGALLATYVSAGHTRLPRTSRARQPQAGPPRSGRLRLV
jgi:Homeodomain-like domain